MKKIDRIIIVLIVVISFFQCKEMDDPYKEYIVPNGITYPGKIVSPKARSGMERVEFNWLRGTDLNVTSACIYWNNFSDSVLIDIPADQDTITYLLQPLDEATYSFVIKTYDRNGNVSVPTEVNCKVYGDSYRSYLVNRGIQSHIVENGILKIEWSAADITNGMIRTDIQYRNQRGDSVIVRVPWNESSVSIPDYDTDSEFYRYKTYFLPDTLCIDTFMVAYEENTPLSKLDKKDWVATCDSYEPNAQLPTGGPASFTIDDDLNTFWHTQHAEAMPGFPHWLAYDLKKKVEVTCVELNSRKTYFGEGFTQFMIQGSNDGERWENYGNYTLAKTDATQLFEPDRRMVTRHIRIYMTEGPSLYTHLAEFSLLGKNVKE